jgi:hypothetical protein
LKGARYGSQVSTAVTRDRHHTSMASSQPQQVNVADLELPQLADVKRQLDEVRILAATPLRQRLNAFLRTGTHPPYQLVRAAQAGPGKVQSMRRERERSQV